MAKKAYSYGFNTDEPIMARDRKPFREGFRVVTVVPGKEHQVIYATTHSNPDIQSLYEEFKLCDNKLFWLSENRERLQRFDINVNGLIEAHRAAA